MGQQFLFVSLYGTEVQTVRTEHDWMGKSTFDVFPATISQTLQIKSLHDILTILALHDHESLMTG